MQGGSMYGSYLKCETCPATIGGEEVTPRQQGIPTLRHGDSATLRRLAGERGWTTQKLGGYHYNDNDWCPACSAKRKEQGQG